VHSNPVAIMVFFAVFLSVVFEILSLLYTEKILWVVYAE